MIGGVGILFVVAIHLAIVAALLRDRIVLPINKIGQSVIVQLLKQEKRPPENVKLAPLHLKAPPVTIEMPQLELPLGTPVVSRPLVVIGAKFSPEVALTVPAAEYAAGAGQLADMYRAEISVQIFEDGAVGEVRVEKSDGNPALDNFIVAYATTHWHFIPAANDGVPVVSWKTVRVEMTRKAMLIH